MRYILEDILNIANTAKKLNFNNKKFLITGSTGLIGSVFVQSLLKITDDKNVVVVTNDIDKAKKHWIDKCFEFYTYDNLNNVPPIDYIVHLASPTDSKYMVEKPVDTISFMYESTKRLLAIARKHSSSFLYISSMEVYGICDDSLRVENELGFLPLVNTRNSYPEAKRLCELLCYSYFKQYDVPIFIARLAQSFGAGVDINEKRIFGYLGRCAFNKENIVLKTKGDSYGNYCYLADAISSFFYILAKGTKGETYNVVGDNMRYTILELANIVANNITKHAIAVSFDLNGNCIYPSPTLLNMNNAKIKTLGWRPQHNIIDCFERMIGNWENE